MELSPQSQKSPPPKKTLSRRVELTFRVLVSGNEPVVVGDVKNIENLSSKKIDLVSHAITTKLKGYSNDKSVTKVPMNIESCNDEALQDDQNPSNVLIEYVDDDSENNVKTQTTQIQEPNQKPKSSAKNSVTQKRVRNGGFFLIALFSLFSLLYVYGAFDTSSSYKGSECLDPKHAYFMANTSLTIVMHTYSRYCDCVPDWMDQDVYFDPSATLYIAIFVVVAYIIVNRLKPLLLVLLDRMVDFYNRKVNSFSEKDGLVHDMARMLRKFNLLPEHIKDIIEKELQEVFPKMPSFRISEKETLAINLEHIDHHHSKINSQQSTSILFDVANKNFIAWIGSVNTVSELEEIHATIRSVVFSKLENLYIETDQVDSTAIFAGQLLLGIAILIDYFLVQQWPSGNSWLCRWAYFSSVVMYKPFTIPMWSCLVATCQYSFASVVFNKTRDLKSGTPYGSPVPRSWFTSIMMGTVGWLQLLWFFGTLGVVSPLLFIFSPIILVPSFVVPVVLIFLTQWLLECFNKKIVDVKPILDTSKPMAFHESGFALKAASTQLVSINIIVFALLPFYNHGFEWWLNGASQFLWTNIDIPSLMFQIMFTFKWPEFHQPRLEFQLGLGVLFIVLQFLLKYTKYLMLVYGDLILMNDQQPGLNEKNMLSAFSMVTWYPFRFPMEALQAAGQRTISEYYGGFDTPLNTISRESKVVNNQCTEKYKKSPFWLKCIIKLIFGMPCYLLWKLVVPFYRFIVLLLQADQSFGVNNFTEVETFASTETAMSYKSVVFGHQYELKEIAQATKLLFARCPWVEFKFTNGDILLYTAAMNGEDEVVKVLIEAKANVNTRNSDDCTGLILAAERGYINIVNLLISAKADVNALNKFNENALLKACVSGHIEIVKILLAAKAEVNIRNQSGETPFAYAHESIAIMKLLIAAHTDLEDRDKNGYNALMQAVQKDQLEVLKLLIATKVDLNVTDKNGSTVLMQAAKRNQVEVVKLLINAKVELNVQDQNGSTALMRAAENNYFDVAKLLIDAQADVTVKDPNTGSTARDLASANSIHSPLVKLIETAERAHRPGGWNLLNKW